MTAIWWIRRDLRLRDNHALCAALARGAPVVPLFILDPAILRSRYHRSAAGRTSFLHEGLRSLDEGLRARGNRLIIRAGEPEKVIAEVMRESGAAVVFAEEDYSPYARRRDAAVAEGSPLQLVPGLTLHHPGEVTKADGGCYTVFTPFSRAWKALPIPPDSVLPAPGKMPAVPRLSSLDLPPGRREFSSFPPGEASAQKRLEIFLNGPIYRYDRERDLLARDGTSSLSPYIRFGMLSSRDAVCAALRARRSGGSDSGRVGPDVWLNELIWREFYQAVLYHFPTVLKEAFRPAFRRIRWITSTRHLHAWQQGTTGIPVIDAAMRQLLICGWMHNRARMITASFLAKNLLVNWQEGELWFMQHLLDGDPAANNGGWQWASGTGTDAAPYFRVFNPVLQSRKFDPEGEYIRRWVPELNPVPDRFIHEPWKMPEATQHAAGCIIGRNYPAPIVDLAESRTRALAAFRRAAGK